MGLYGVQIQPRDIDVPAEDPFRNDLLDRKQPAEILTHLVGSIEGPCVIAVDAAWGAGKTTFLRLWAQQLRNEGFPSSSSMRGRPTSLGIRLSPSRPN